MRIAVANSDLHRQVVTYAVLAASLAGVLFLIHCRTVTAPIRFPSRVLARVCGRLRLTVRALAMAPQRTNKKDGPDELPFPIPGKLQEDGQLAIEFIDVYVD